MSEPVVYLRFRWRCESCGADSSFRVAPTTTCDAIEELVREQHRVHSPRCPRLRYSTERLENEFVYPEGRL